MASRALSSSTVARNLLINSNIFWVSIGSYSVSLILNRNPFLPKYSNKVFVSPFLIAIRFPNKFFSIRAPLSPKRTRSTTGARPQLEPWQKKTLEEWKAQHPGGEPEKNWNLSMDGLMMTENPDTSIYVKQLVEMTAEEPDPQKELLYEKLSELPEDDQKLYRLYFIEERSQEEIAKMKGMSQNTISKKLRRIKKQLIEMCRKAV